MEIKGITCGWSYDTICGGNPETKIENWWKGQMYGFLPAGECQISLQVTIITFVVHQ